MTGRTRIWEENLNGSSLRGPKAGPVLQVENLSIAFLVEGGSREAVKDVSLSILQRQIYGLVGESGSGKTTLALGAVRYLPQNGRVTGGAVRLAGRDVFSLSRQQLRSMWGGEVGMVYQSPSTALNPSLTIGRQLGEVGRVHLNLSRSAAEKRAIEVLEQVAMPEASAVLQRYPHQLSGGMLQRCVIAMSLIPQPRLLIMDEPTTALDVTTQAVVLDLIGDLRRQLDSAILYITHDLGVVARICDRVGVMHGGELVEEADVRTIFRRPKHPYTVELLGCVPRFRPGQTNQADTGQTGEEQPRVQSRGPEEPVLLRVLNVSKRFEGGAGLFRRRSQEVIAIDDVSFALRRGRTLGLVGESGSGKTTTARVIVGLEEPSEGEVRLDDTRLAPQLRGRPQSTLRRLQMVFQNPDSSLNPRQTVREIIGRAAALLRGLQGADLEREVDSLLEAVRLSPAYASRLPSELSGGEKQRVAIARAFAASPEIVVCDEPISSLDVCVQRSLLNLLRDLQLGESTSYLFISHDLAAVQDLSDEIAVMYMGHIVEWGDADLVLKRPYHPYTEVLLSAVPVADPDLEQRRTRLRAATERQVIRQGCPFSPRCHRNLGDVCSHDSPAAQMGSGNHHVSCHIPLAQLARLQSPAFRLEGEGLEPQSRDDHVSGPGRGPGGRV